MRVRGSSAKVALATACILVISGCSDAVEEPGAPGGSHAGGAITLQLPSDPGSLDPHQSSGGRPMLRMAYDTLVAETPDGRIVPQLAESWEATASKVELTLHEGITCSDGSEFTAETVANNFERIKDPDAGVPFTTTFLGSTEFTVSHDNDKRTVTIDLPEPFGGFLQNLTFFPPMICQSGLDDPSLLATESHGTGPFVLSDFTINDEYTFTKREGYTWGADGATTAAEDFPSEVALRVVSDETTAANLMLSGELQGVFLNQPGAYERLEAKGLSSQANPNAAMFIHFNFLKEDSPVQDLRVRTALAETINRTELSVIATGSPDNVSVDVALPQSICAPAMTGEHLVGFDPEDADRQLQDAGWVRDADGWTREGEKLALNVIVTSSAGFTNKAVADYVSNAWADLGVAVTIEDLDQPTGLERRAEGAYDVWVGAWTNVFHPGTISPYLVDPESLNYSYLANSEYDELAAEAIGLAHEDSCEAWAAAQDAIDRNVSMVPLYYTAARLISAEGVSFTANRSYFEPVSLKVQ